MNFSSYKFEINLKMISLEQSQRLLSICSKKIEKNPNNIRTLLLRASINIKLNSLPQAENDLYKIINQNPDSSIAYYLLGIISQRKKNYQKSLFYLTKSIELEPNNVNAIYSRAAVYNELNFFKKAIDDYFSALEKDSMNNNNDKNIYNNIAKIMGSLNDDQENDKNDYYNKSDIDLDAEINNYIYKQLKTMSLNNNKENIQYEFMENENNGSKNHKEKENEVKEIYDPNEVRDENEFLFGQRNSNIDHIIKNNNKIKNIEKENVEEKNLNDININKLNNGENNKEIDTNKKSRYHNDGHIINDMINNEANIMISKEEETENNLNLNNKININNLNINKNIGQYNNENEQLDVNLNDIQKQKQLYSF